MFGGTWISSYKSANIWAHYWWLLSGCLHKAKIIKIILRTSFGFIVRQRLFLDFISFFSPILELFIFVLCRHQNINNDKTQQNFFKGKASDEPQIEWLSWLTQVIKILGFLSCQIGPLPRQPSLSSCLCSQHSKQRQRSTAHFTKSRPPDILVFLAMCKLDYQTEKPDE